MPTDHHYETALKAAMTILADLNRPKLSEPAKLACLTYAILEILHRTESANG